MSGEINGFRLVVDDSRKGYRAVATDANGLFRLPANYNEYPVMYLRWAFRGLGQYLNKFDIDLSDVDMSNIVGIKIDGFYAMIGFSLTHTIATLLYLVNLIIAFYM